MYFALIWIRGSRAVQQRSLRLHFAADMHTRSRMENPPDIGARKEIGVSGVGGGQMQDCRIGWEDQPFTSHSDSWLVSSFGCRRCPAADDTCSLSTARGYFGPVVLRPGSAHVRWQSHLLFFYQQAGRPVRPSRPERKGLPPREIGNRTGH